MKLQMQKRENFFGEEGCCKLLDTGHFVQRGKWCLVIPLTLNQAVSEPVREVNLCFQKVRSAELGGEAVPGAAQSG